MTTTEAESATTKTVAEDTIAVAEIQTFDNVGMPATHRCFCVAQAYVEVEVYDSGVAKPEYGAEATEATKRSLYFCAHHYNQHELALIQQAVRIMDHRPFLEHQERMYKGAVEVK